MGRLERVSIFWRQWDKYQSDRAGAKARAAQQEGSQEVVEWQTAKQKKIILSCLCDPLS